jgi:ribonuclease BN (tRNA processing enzyme)
VNLDALNVRDLSGGEKFSVGAATVTTAHVNHTIHTLAYRFALGGRSIVISGDLAYSESLVELARGADVLVMDSGTLPSPAGGAPAGGARGGGAGARGGAGPAGVGRGGRAGRAGRGGAAAGAAQQGSQERAHPTLAEVASMASQAGVKCLVLSHINQPAVDEAATATALRAGFSGKVVVGQDLMSVNVDCEVGSARQG